MKILISFFVGTAAWLLLLSMSQGAHAQWNNQPYSFSRGGAAAGAGAGMTPAYRELMLERRLLGRSTSNNFIRGADGSLVNIERKGDQAFARPTAAPYAASQSGFSLGAGYTAAVGGSLRAPARPEPAGEDMPAIFGTAGGVPINSWILQLANLPDLAS